ncbi:LytTR family transcriptional regulator DNA-binding domain-containing protein [Paenibacillus macerans]|uniref:LytTR family transcriptional regulator DNA-binding domain-containing protein n=1 Tax=Paenibacillus macerans TaxID=44252 RepID=UPI00203C87BA|nr:LytTR family transcriptional regulator DNA-binding domain-containing protein [Paenibacillus macerans]MCM3703782.1 LytTR family transcriptional regulator DNA-binding domain-containing protein [Paenibacillus macerans]
MKILVVKMFNRVGDNSDFVEINLSDINFVDLWSPTEHSAKVPAYHTPFGSFLALSIIKDISQAYGKYGFGLVDRSTVVNFKNVLSIDPESNGSKITFKDYSYIHVRKKHI